MRKELNVSNGDYESMSFWKPHSDRSNKKRPSEFVGEIIGSGQAVLPFAIWLNSGLFYSYPSFVLLV